jgi:hypothetical protein
MIKRSFFRQRIFHTLLLWTLILCACSAGRFSPEASSRHPVTDTPSPAAIPVSTTQVFPLTKLVATLATPHIDQSPDGAITTAPPTFEGCAYMWAYKDMPELSSSFQQSIQTLQPEAQANAYTFGEDCIHTDGSVTFLAKETDFNITLQVDDLSNESDLGEWIVKIMQVIETIPPDQIVGPRPGRVSLEFRSSNDQMFVNFYVNQYQSLPFGLSNAEIYQALQAPQ